MSDADDAWGAPRRPWWRREGPVDFVAPGEVVWVDERQHWVALAVPALRTLALLLLLLTGTSAVPLLLAAAATALWARERLRQGWRAAAVVAVAVCLLALWLSSSPWGFVVGNLLVWAWAADDALDWWHDRLVVTDKRFYRRHGWVTEHAPSMALQSAVFIDVAVSPLDRLLRCGTLRFDSAAQRDAPLARFSLVPDVRDVHHKVLELRAGSTRPIY